MAATKSLSAAIVVILMMVMVTLVVAAVVVGGGVVGTLATATITTTPAASSSDDIGSSRVECFTNLFGKEKVGMFLSSLSGVATFADLSSQLENGQQHPDVILKILLNMPIEKSKLNDLILCLQDTGI